MFESVHSALRMDRIPFQSKFIHLVEEEDLLGTFLTYHFLHLALRQSSNVTLVGLENTFGHYNGVSSKFGINMTKSREAGQINFIDGLKLVSENVNDDGVVDTLPLLNSIISQVKQCVKENTVLIIDKISLLHSLGLTNREMLALVQELQSICEQHKSCLVTRSRTLTGLGEDDSHDEGDHISAFLSHTANLTIAVRPLASGRSSTVTGNLCFLWNIPEEGQIQHFQFRVEEKDVKVFAIGTSGAVL